MTIDHSYLVDAGDVVKGEGEAIGVACARHLKEGLVGTEGDRGSAVAVKLIESYLAVEPTHRIIWRTATEVEGHAGERTLQQVVGLTYLLSKTAGKSEDGACCLLLIDKYHSRMGRDVTAIVGCL